MNAEHAWQTVLGQLQMEMPKASFETWVRDTKPVSFDSGVMTVAVRNAYARDWLDTRLATPVSRLLMTATESTCNWWSAHNCVAFKDIWRPELKTATRHSNYRLPSGGLITETPGGILRLFPTS